MVFPESCRQYSSSVSQELYKEQDVTLNSLKTPNNSITGKMTVIKCQESSELLGKYWTQTASLENANDAAVP